MEIAAAGVLGDDLDLRRPQLVGYQVHDLVLRLDPAGHAQEAGGLASTWKDSKTRDQARRW
jgi:hypothetical protein